MARYIPRTCPRCRDYFGVAASHPTPHAKELPIDAFCAVCGYHLDGWRLIVGGERAPESLLPRLRKAVR